MDCAGRIRLKTVTVEGRDIYHWCCVIIAIGETISGRRQKSRLLLLLLLKVMLLLELYGREAAMEEVDRTYGRQADGRAAYQARDRPLGVERVVGAMIRSSHHADGSWRSFVRDGSELD